MPTKQWLQVQIGNEIVIHFLLSFISRLDFKLVRACWSKFGKCLKVCFMRIYRMCHFIHFKMSALPLGSWPALKIVDDFSCLVCYFLLWCTLRLFNWPSHIFCFLCIDTSLWSSALAAKVTNKVLDNQI